MVSRTLSQPTVTSTGTRGRLLRCRSGERSPDTGSYAHPLGRAACLTVHNAAAGRSGQAISSSQLQRPFVGQAAFLLAAALPLLNLRGRLAGLPPLMPLLEVTCSGPSASWHAGLVDLASTPPSPRSPRPLPNNNEPNCGCRVRPQPTGPDLTELATQGVR
jgi:hypothetical protein